MKVKCTKKFHIDQHLKTALHIANVNIKKKTNQTFLTTLGSVPLEKDTFTKDLCDMMVSADIAWKKLENPKFRKFLEKYTARKIPDESTVRKNYLDVVYKDVSMKKVLHQIIKIDLISNFVKTENLF